MSPRNNQNNVIFPGETLEQGSPYQDMPFSLVESPLEFSIDPNPISDHDTPQGQSADFQNMSDGQYQNPYHTMSVNAEGTIDFNAQVNSGSPMYQPTRQQSSPDSNWTGLPIAYPQGAHDHGPIESQESEQDELVTQISSDFDPSLSPTSPVYTNLMKQNHFSHPNPASTLEDPLLQKAPVVSSQLPLQEHYQFQDVHTPSSSTRDCRRTVPELHQMPRQLDPGRRTLSDYMITLDKDNHVKVEGKICRTKKEGINQFSETHLQVPPPGSSPGLTYGSPGSSLEYLEDPAKPSLKRKRKLTPSGRARAAKVRKVGACSECRIRKVKVRFFKENSIPRLRFFFSVTTSFLRILAKQM